MPDALNPPLVVDLDGTLTPADTLAESVVLLVKRFPASLFCLPLWLLRGRAAFKAEVVSRVSIRATELPYRIELLDYLRQEKAKGRRLILATAAHRAIASDVASHLDLFDAVLATDAGDNLKGSAKLEAIQKLVGGPFVYAGDSQADIPIWKAAQACILVDVSPGVGKTIRASIPVEREFVSEPATLKTWLRALRLHQWVKNLLLFVPLLTNFSLFDPNKAPAAILAFLAFSLAASATYIGNDLLDLQNDRAHPRKKTRPFASARIPVLSGVVVGIALLVAGLTLAFFVSNLFVLSLLLYLFLTAAYSLVLKEHALIDVLVLAILYTLRIMAGSMAVDIHITSWLLAFSIFVFFSLALVKRCSELVLQQQQGEAGARGRDYRADDLAVLWPMGIGAAMSAVVIFGLFINAPETQARYATPQLLWVVDIALIYWLARLWIKTSRGEMDDDPVVYAFSDNISRLVIVGVLAVILAAHFFDLALWKRYLE